MPIYEYQCDSCGHQFDVIQKFSDAPLKQCPECSEEALKKLISAPSFRLKGTGWYETDFKDKKGAKPSGPAASDSKSSSGESSSGSDTSSSSESSGSSSKSESSSSTPAAAD